MIFLTNLLPKEKSTEYYHKYMKLAIQKNKMDDIYENSARYYETIGDYKKAITYIDSVMQYGKYRQQQLLPIYVVKSILYSKMGDYKNAYLTIRERDSLRILDNSERILEQMSESGPGSMLIS